MNTKVITAIRMALIGVLMLMLGLLLVGLLSSYGGYPAYVVLPLLGLAGAIAFIGVLLLAASVLYLFD